MRVDLLKVPHHGSERNFEQEFFEQVTADHYVISADGKYGNPDVETLRMLTQARGKDRYTIWFTNKVTRVENFLSKDSKKGRKYSGRLSRTQGCVHRGCLVVPRAAALAAGLPRWRQTQRRRPALLAVGALADTPRTDWRTNWRTGRMAYAKPRAARVLAEGTSADAVHPQQFGEKRRGSLTPVHRETIVCPKVDGSMR